MSERQTGTASSSGSSSDGGLRRWERTEPDVPAVEQSESRPCWHTDALHRNWADAAMPCASSGCLASAMPSSALTVTWAAVQAASSPRSSRVASAGAFATSLDAWRLRRRRSVDNDRASSACLICEYAAQRLLAKLRSAPAKRASRRRRSRRRDWGHPGASQGGRNLRQLLPVVMPHLIDGRQATTRGATTGPDSRHLRGGNTASISVLDLPGSRRMLAMVSARDRPEPPPFSQEFVCVASRFVDANTVVALLYASCLFGDAEVLTGGRDADSQRCLGIERLSWLDRMSCASRRAGHTLRLDVDARLDLRRDVRGRAAAPTSPSRSGAMPPEPMNKQRGRER